jgi:hypothetical protein
MDWTAVGSIGTFLAFVVAFFAIVIERLERSRASRRRQAEQISGWLDVESYGCPSPRGSVATVLNGSGQPVYHVIVWLVSLQGGGGPATGEEVARSIQAEPESDAWERTRPETLSVLPPGMSVVCLPDWLGGMHSVPAVEIAFTDAAGRHWIRRAEGELQKISKEPAFHYGIGLPQGWTIPTRVSK